ncbi:hypothetical protein SLEP1_g141 [Rubroshorea leprosula]|uniref:Rapid alkalinization factor n=1 Tax=Rubroshorea leprosula TaxID=152421 RepID=A0AAV5HKI5_9ROSI|nr:hypothetical protein SLEP1_g141 [Rubroshorea leprosula]
MGYSKFWLSLLVICALLATAASTFDIGGEAFLPARSECRGTIAECMMMGKNAVLDFDDGEFAMDSESNRRILAASKYIGYGALLKNSVPCSQRGASYYNCKPGAQANPYTRGCSKITRCRS